MKNVGEGGVFALVLYTGKDTKINLNQGNYKYKSSSTEKNLNLIFTWQIFWIFGISFIMSVISHFFLTLNFDDMPYVFDSGPNKSWVVFYQFFSFWLLMTRFLPLDVIVNVEVGKIFASKFIEFDSEMISVDAENGELKACRVQSMQLPEELGQISYLFCDKTGTLTKNELVFRSVSFKGILCQSPVQEEALQQVYAANCKTSELLFKCFCICHDIVMVLDKEGKRVPQGSSQDELVMLEVAHKSLYFSLAARDQDTLTLKDNQSGSLKVFTVLKRFEFTSERRMMSVVVRDENGSIFAFVKGADSVIEPLLKKKSKEKKSKDKLTLDDLDDMANNGLRTLLYGYKKLDDIDTSVDGLRNLTMKDVESDLKLLGATGVEDLLQTDVQKCIIDFRAANIKTWILTGDKDATALNIGLSCGVFSNERPVAQIDSFENANFDVSTVTQHAGKDILVSGLAIA